MAKKTQSTDKAHDPIHVSEDFRVAKRNVLFWAAATILIAVGTAHSDSSIEVAAIVKELRFGQGFLTFGSLLVLTFMAFGYYRAERSLLARHTGFAIAHRMHENADLAVEVGNELEKVKSNIEVTQSALNSANAFLGDGWSAFEQLNEQTMKRVDALSHGIIPDFAAMAGLTRKQPSDPAMTIVHVEQVANRVRIEAKEWLRAEAQKQREAFIESARKSIEAFDRAVKQGETTVENAASPMAAAIDRFDKLSAQLHGFADSIGSGEKRFFYWHDRAPVIMVTGVAFVLGIWRLTSPFGLAAWMAHFFG